MFIKVGEKIVLKVLLHNFSLDFTSFLQFQVSINLELCTFLDLAGVDHQNYSDVNPTVTGATAIALLAEMIASTCLCNNHSFIIMCMVKYSSINCSTGQPFVILLTNVVCRYVQHICFGGFARMRLKNSLIQMADVIKLGGVVCCYLCSFCTVYYTEFENIGLHHINANAYVKSTLVCLSFLKKSHLA